MNIETRKIPGYSAKDVLVFVAGYWWSQPLRFTILLLLITFSTFIASNVPNALAAFFESARTHSDAASIWMHLGMLLATVFGSAFLFNLYYRIYIVFENEIFKKLLNDAFAHVEGLSEQYFVNTFAGSMIAALSRGKTSLRMYEDTVLFSLLPTTLIVVYSVILLAFRLPILSVVLVLYLIVVIFGSCLLVTKYSGPAQAAYADAQDRFGAHLADCLTGIFGLAPKNWSILK